jgi:hypothetical protein
VAAALYYFMTLLEEVKGFARDFVNGNRTQERLLKVKAAYRQLTGENLRITCETCYIEAIFKILKAMETPKKLCRYQLKKGAILQPFGGGIITNANLTDELAEECLRTVRGAASLFAKMPKFEPEPDLAVVPPAATDLNDDLGAGEPAANAKVNDDAGTAKPNEPAADQPPKVIKKKTTAKRKSNKGKK